MPAVVRVVLWVVSIIEMSKILAEMCMFVIMVLWMVMPREVMIQSI